MQTVSYHPRAWAYHLAMGLESLPNLVAYKESQGHHTLEYCHREAFPDTGQLPCPWISDPENRRAGNGDQLGAVILRSLTYFRALASRAALVRLLHLRLHISSARSPSRLAGLTTGLQGMIENALFPPHKEVSMQSEARTISVCQDVRLLWIGTFRPRKIGIIVGVVDLHEELGVPASRFRLLQ